MRINSRLASTVRQPTQVRWGTCLTRLTGLAVTIYTLTPTLSRGEGVGSGKLLFFFPDTVSALVQLARHHFAQFFVELKFNGFLLALLLAFLLVFALSPASANA